MRSPAYRPRASCQPIWQPECRGWSGSATWPCMNTLDVVGPIITKQLDDFRTFSSTIVKGFP